MLATGCHPSEAAYLVINNSFHPTSGESACNYTAVVPPDAAKSRYNKWVLDVNMNLAVELVGCLHAKKLRLDRLGNLDKFS